MVSRRTRVLLLIAVVCTVAAGWVAHERQPLCAQTRHVFARRAPIAGASGRDTFVCSAMYNGMPWRDKVIAGAWVFGTLALLRSLLIDRKTRRERRLRQPDEWMDE